MQMIDRNSPKTFLSGLVAILILVGLTVVPESAAQADPVAAFPGAEGFGTSTIGGRGGLVIKVTNTNDSGPGSLREALENHSGPRIVVFDTGGLITLSDSIKITDPFVTIAGQTAPGDGIAIRSAPLIVATHDVIIRNLRFRVGDLEDGAASTSRDGITISTTYADSDVYNVVVDHSSISWGVDENLSTWTSSGQSYLTRDITIQRSISSEALDNSIHIDEGDSGPGPHSMGALLGRNGFNMSFHHNLLAHNKDRNPRVSGITDAEVVNNVIYNWGGGPTKVSDHKNVVHILNNYYKPGSDSLDRDIQFSSSGIDPDTRIYVDGNYVDPIPGETRDVDSNEERCTASENDLIVRYASGWCDASPPSYRALVAQFASPLTTVQSAAGAYTEVLNDVGATVPALDSVDSRIIGEVQSRTGGIIDSQAERASDPTCVPQDPDCGWQVYDAGSAPVDTDGDGMPDTWESSEGLDTEIDDSALDADGDGYTNIEEYINNFFGEATEPEPDSTAPVIMLLGDAVVAHDVGTSYVDAGAIATDGVDGDITSEMTTMNPVDVNVVGDYAVSYNVSDAAGNSAIEVIRTVSVVVSPPAPEIFEARISSGDDDSEERGTNGRISLTSSDLELVEDGYKGAQTVGLRFSAVNVPNGASITAAHVQFVADEYDSETTTLTLTAEDVDSSAALTKADYDLSTRTRTAASISWAPDAWSTNDIVDTPDMSAMIQEVVGRGAWVEGNPMTIIVQGAGKRVAEAYNGESESAALLHIEYAMDAPVITLVGESEVTIDLGSTYTDAGAIAFDVADGDLTPLIVTLNPVDTGAEATYYVTYDVTDADGNAASQGVRTVHVVDPTAVVHTFEVRISEDEDDSEESLSDGDVSRWSSDLELVREGSESQIVGLRFATVDVPQGATITHATITFVADEYDSETTSLVIRAEDVDSSAALVSTDFDLSTKGTTAASASWDPPAWSTGDVATSSDIAGVIQEIVDRSGWASNNPITILITGSGKRVAESYDGSSQDAALLHIEYTTN